MAKHYDKQFKLDAVQYYHDHKKLRTAKSYATNLGISRRHYHAGKKNCVKQVILKAVVPVTMLLMKQKKSHD